MLKEIETGVERYGGCINSHAVRSIKELISFFLFPLYLIRREKRVIDLFFCLRSGQKTL